MTDDYKVSFSPTEKQVREIESWLFEENQQTGDGFDCDWNDIKSSFDKNELVTISLNDKTIGFATWRLLIKTEKIARIENTVIKQTYRKKGIGKQLTTHLLNFLKDKGVWIVDLQCSPKTSEPIWKRLGFVEFPDPPENYNFHSGGNKKLYSILVEHLQIDSVQRADETIELWNVEPFMTDENTPPTYIWNLEFIDGTRKLSKPIIHPAYYKWRMRWKAKGKTIKDNQIQRFKTENDLEAFIIIDELTL